jgi:preprotein translocase subunit SecA
VRGSRAETVVATLATGVQALAGVLVHVMTVSGRPAKRDTEAVAPLYPGWRTTARQRRTP